MIGQLTMRRSYVPDNRNLPSHSSGSTSIYDVAIFVDRHPRGFLVFPSSTRPTLILSQTGLGT